jgi:hypothetical protein
MNQLAKEKNIITRLRQRFPVIPEYTGEPFDFFSFNKNWINFVTGRISLGWQSLPPGVHLTIAEGHTAWNLHLTKETAGNRKPRYDVLSIDKKDLDTLAPHFHEHLLETFLVPVEIASLKADTSPDIAFIPMADVLSKRFSGLLYKKFERHIRRHCRIKQNTRLKITGTERDLIPSNFLSRPLKRKIIRYIRPLPAIPTDRNVYGIAITREGVKILLFAWGQWHEIKSPSGPFEVIRSFMQPELFGALQQKITEGLSLLTIASSHTDMPPAAPIRIVPVVQSTTETTQGL